MTKITWRRCAYACAALVSLFLAAIVHAHPKTDVITLRNADRITGEVKSLAGGRLSVATDAMGTVGLEWKDIASIDSDYRYELRLSDGQRLFGSLRPAGTPGMLAFENVLGDKKVLESLDVVELRPVAQSLEERLEIYLSANYAFTKASGVTQTEFRANVSYEDEDTLNALTSRLTISDTDSESTSSSRINLSRKVWTDRQAVYRQVFGGHEKQRRIRTRLPRDTGCGAGTLFYRQ